MGAIADARKAIRLRGSANLDWTDAGLWAGNDYHHPTPLYEAPDKPRAPMPSRHYIPYWRREAEQMYAELDITRAQVLDDMREQERWDEVVAWMDAARQRFKEKEAEKESLGLFELEWVRDGD